VAAAGSLDQVDALLAQLPATNANVLRLLLEVCYWVSHFAAETEMDALALAQALAPCVAWLPSTLRATRTGSFSIQGPDGSSEDAAAAAAAAASSSGAADRIVALEGEEAQAIVLVMEALINRFAHIYG